ncbi:methyltransferase domain-containing protein [Amycolatopsis cynarae]|uniref:Methyltransferase domain-containing protein n=1 Tax=Amycolatopsis cynarae TaxID=2995223 RepID=A0ABY7B6U0_9PSEU|nr:methyltransferase domain-containing protein [Amycolatopsis sp. HUAS 11-8]WAL66488.1 methyltransferase domain-containing protein [Amycolatopsis sp. HUAS 11-8]
MNSPFDAALRTGRCTLELAGGERVALPAQRWLDAPGAGDELLLARCVGPTLDIGCGPGRLTTELTFRGVSSLGIDTSFTAVRLTRRRGGTALRRDVFGRVPGEGRWHFALLADGNIGIGGDPVRLLRRVFRLLGPDGHALVELEPPGRGARRDRVRLGGGPWFPWAWLGADALGDLARALSLRVVWTASHGTRHFAALAREA